MAYISVEKNEVMVKFYILYVVYDDFGLLVSAMYGPLTI